MARKAPDPWREALDRARSVAARWLAAPGVLAELRDVRDRLGSPQLDVTTAISAVAEIMGFELVLDAEGGLAEQYFANPLTGFDGRAQAQARETVVGWVAAIDAATQKIATLVPPDAPFDVSHSRLTIAELVLTDLDLEGSPANIAAALQFPPAHVSFDRRGSMNVAWFADWADMRLGRQVARAFRPRGRRTARYRGTLPRRANERAVRARAGVRALVRQYPTITARLFEPHWPPFVGAALGDLIWGAFAGPARWTTTDGRFTQAGFARLLREVRDEPSPGPSRA
jgi:hypothetical protein